jgi:hypothetical protein
MRMFLCFRRHGRSMRSRSEDGRRQAAGGRRQAAGGRRQAAEKKTLVLQTMQGFLCGSGLLPLPLRDSLDGCCYASS